MAILLGLLSVTFFQVIVPTQFLSVKISSNNILRLCISLSSQEIKITPSLLNSSQRSFNLGVIIQSHLSCRVKSSKSTSFPSHSLIIGLLTLSLYIQCSLPV